nr:hypothetical protein [Xylophilus sp.]
MSSRTSGQRLRKLRIAVGSSDSMAERAKPMPSQPARAEATRRASLSSRCAWASSSWAQGCTNRPSAVSGMGRAARSNSGPPISSSNCAMRMLMAVGATKSVCAALAAEPASTTSQKYCSCFRFIFIKQIGENAALF